MEMACVQDSSGIIGFTCNAPDFATEADAEVFLDAMPTITDDFVMWTQDRVYYPTDDGAIFIHRRYEYMVLSRERYPGKDSIIGNICL